MSDAPTYSYGIIGAGRSGLAVARLLRSEGESLLVSDARPAGEMEEARALLESIDVEYEFGGHTERLLTAETIVLSPGVPPDLPILQQAREMGRRITNEIEIAALRCRGTIVAITGTNGKTTTTELIGHICRAAGRRTFVAGNVGTPFSAVVGETDDESVVVLELSSFQLEEIETFHPRVGVLLNVTPDHLDRYPSIEEYGGAKLRLTMNLDADDTLIYNADDEWLSRIGAMEFQPRLLPFTLSGELPDGVEGSTVIDGDLVLLIDGDHESILPVDRIGIPGPHNVMNAMAAALAARSIGVDVDAIGRGLTTFRSLPHRMEDVGTVDGVRYVNDSKGTNTEALRCALQSFTEPIVLIAGGKGKNNVYDELLPLLAARVKAVVLVGDAAEEMARAFAGSTRIEQAGYDMARAVDVAAGLAAEGDVVLLSPACSSFDMFRNFEHRGDVFRALVAERMIDTNDVQRG